MEEKTIASVSILGICLFWTSYAALVPVSTRMSSSNRPQNIFQNINLGRNLKYFGLSGANQFPSRLLSMCLHEVLVMFKEESRRKNVMALPKLTTSFLNGTFETTGGYLKNMASINMKHVFDRDEGSYHIEVRAPIEFQDLEAVYDNVAVDIGERIELGPLKVAASSKDVKVTLGWSRFGRSAELTLGDVAVVSINGNIRVDLGGIGEEYVQTFSHWLGIYVEKELRNILAKELHGRLFAFFPFNCSY